MEIFIFICGIFYLWNDLLVRIILLMIVFISGNTSFCNAPSDSDLMLYYLELFLYFLYLQFRVYTPEVCEKTTLRHQVF